MDKRTLLFILSITALFYLMHQWFDFGGSRVNDISIQEPKTEVVVTGKKPQPTLIPPSQYSKYDIVKLYADIDLKMFATYAVKSGDNFLTLAWDSSLPNELYAEITTDPVPSHRRIILRVTPENEGDPALYTVYPASKLMIPWIPNEGSLPIALIYFEGEKAFKIEGKTEGVEQIHIDSKPDQNALVFTQSHKGGVYGVYYSQKNSLEYLDHISSFEEYALLTFPADKDLEKEVKEQQYYVLENPYQQLVFTNLNAALSEINLPFKSNANPDSVVREIQFDRVIEKDYPLNNLYPQHPYYVPSDKGGPPRKQPPNEGGYYPLIRRNIIGIAGDTTTRINPQYYSLNILEEGSIPDAHLYTLKRFEKDLIEFELSLGNRRITKTFSFPKNIQEAPYCFDVSIKIEGDARGFLVSTGVPEVELISGNFVPTLKYRVNRNGKMKVEEIKPPKARVTFTLQPEWVCNGSGFFGIILDPLTKSPSGFNCDPISGELVPTRLSLVDARYHRYPVEKYPGYTMLLPISTQPGTSTYRVFAGPFDKEILNRVDQTFTNHYTGSTPDYAKAQTYHGWFAFISEPFAKFLFILMSFFYSLTSSWGISIILLTVALRLMLYPLNAWAMKSTAKMQQIGPKLQAVQEKYKNDPQRMKLEQMNLYRKEGVNPFSGCLPMLIQLPFLMGMFDLLKSSFELRGATFIPGWINNLTAPDVLFSWSYPIFFIGNSFHLLPIILGALMYFQSKMTSAMRAKGPLTDAQKQQQSMGSIMAIVFTFLFYNFPSGLCIYWISSTLIGIFQQWMMNKKMLAKT